MPMIRPEASQPDGDGVPLALAASLRHGVNLQGWTLWHEPVFTAREMQRLKADGFDHVRIYFEARASDADITTYPTDLARDWLVQKADAVIANALAAGLAVIVSPTPGIAPEDSPAAIDGHVAALGAYAAHLASRFDTDRIVIETTNEPMFPSQAAWATVEARLIAVVREAAPDMTIMTAANLISGGAWWQLGGLRDTVPHRAENILYSVHTYFPQVFTNQSHGPAPWAPAPGAPQGTPQGPPQGPVSDVVAWYLREGFATKAALDEAVDAFARTADALGVTLHIGEFGTVAHAPPASRLAYLEAITQAFERHDLGWTAWQSHGLHGLTTRGAGGFAPLDPVLATAMGLSGARPNPPLTVTFQAGSPHDLWVAGEGAAVTPGLGRTVTLRDAALGEAGGAGAAVSIARASSGAVTVRNTGEALAVRDVGIADDQNGNATVLGFERAWVSFGNGGNTRINAEATQLRLYTGDGADVIRATAISLPGSALAPAGFVSAGAGDDVITLGQRLPAGAAPAQFEVWAGAGNDRIVITGGGGGTVSGGSGDDWIVSGVGDETLRGDVGIDTLELPGLRASWRFTARQEGTATVVDATGPGGNDTLAGFEWVVFADGEVARFGELWGNQAPTAPALSAADLAEGVLARAVSVDPEGDALTWFLSDSAGGRFGIDRFSGEISLRPGIAASPGERFSLGVGVVDEAGNVMGATLGLVIPGGVRQAEVVTLSNAVAADLAPDHARAWVGEVAGSRVIAGSDVPGQGIVPEARIGITQGADFTLAVAVLTAWNSHKNIHVTDTDGGTVRIDNVVHAGFTGLGDADTTLVVTGTKRGDLLMGGGDDVVTVTAFSNMGGSGNRMTVDAGAGDDRVTVTGHGAWTTALLLGGAGDDVLTFSGGGSATLDGGAGSDVMQGGAGRDRFLLRPGEVEGDRILGFSGAGTWGGDFLVMEGFGAGAALTHQGGGLWRVSYSDGGTPAAETFTLTGVTRLGADDVLWA
jgi:hypothetical protein